MKSPPPRLKKTTNTAIGFAIVSFLLPSIALAQIEITEVMYDAPGSDTGREWIEITNTGSEILNVGKYKLFENETNHGIKLISGSPALVPGQSAVLASDSTKFLTDYPNYNGVLFDTAFLLSNTGESLVLKDASSTVLSTIFYTATEETNGTGGSLQFKNGTLIAALATPGIYPGSFTPVPKLPTKEKTIGKKASSTSPSKNTNPKGAPSGKDKSAPVSFVESPALPASLATAFPVISDFLLWVGGLVAVILLGMAGVLFLLGRASETSVSSEEFTIE